jgi:hypothetical protein
MIDHKAALRALAAEDGCKASLLAGETALITFSLSEDSTDFTLADAVAAGGTLSSLTGSGSSYSATFTPKAGSTTPGTSVSPSTLKDGSVGSVH